MENGHFSGNSISNESFVSESFCSCEQIHFSFSERRQLPSKVKRDGGSNEQIGVAKFAWMAKNKVQIN